MHQLDVAEIVVLGGRKEAFADGELEIVFAWNYSNCKLSDRTFTDQ